MMARDCGANTKVVRSRSIQTNASGLESIFLLYTSTFDFVILAKKITCLN